MVWLRESPDHKYRKIATKVVVGMKIQWSVMAVAVRVRPEVRQNKCLNALLVMMKK